MIFGFEYIIRAAIESRGRPSLMPADRGPRVGAKKQLLLYNIRMWEVRRKFQIRRTRSSYKNNNNIFYTPKTSYNKIIISYGAVTSSSSPARASRRNPPPPPRSVSSARPSLNRRPTDELRNYNITKTFCRFLSPRVQAFYYVFTRKAGENSSTGVRGLM